MRFIIARVVQVWCRCAADVKTSLSGQPSARSNSPAIISLLRRACQTILRRPLKGSARTSEKLIVSMPSGASGPHQRALASRAIRGAIMRLVAVTPV